jgi:hypothetical protein
MNSSPLPNLYLFTIHNFILKNIFKRLFKSYKLLISIKSLASFHFFIFKYARPFEFISLSILKIHLFTLTLLTIRIANLSNNSLES